MILPKETPEHSKDIKKKHGCFHKYFRASYNWSNSKWIKQNDFRWGLKIYGRPRKQTLPDNLHPFTSL